MDKSFHSSLQIREVFHLEFLRRFSAKVKGKNYAVKGGVNLRFFFGSVRYSEDMDIDISGISTACLRDTVLDILKSRLFRDSLRSFGIGNITAPDMAKAKQTETTQRFKTHLLTASGEDLFTKIEFSRRGFFGAAVMETASPVLLRNYKIPPFFVSHYPAVPAAAQKIKALASRKEAQARDIFDLFMLIGRVDAGEIKQLKLTQNILQEAYERIFAVNFAIFRDTVVSYLSDEDRGIYGNEDRWQDLQLKAAEFINSVAAKIK